MENSRGGMYSWQFSLKLEGACGRVSKACENLISRFSLEGGRRHSGPTHALYKESFVNALFNWLQRLNRKLVKDLTNYTD